MQVPSTPQAVPQSTHHSIGYNGYHFIPLYPGTTTLQSALHQMRTNFQSSTEHISKKGTKAHMTSRLMVAFFKTVLKTLEEEYSTAKVLFTSKAAERNVAKASCGAVMGAINAIEHLRANYTEQKKNGNDTVISTHTYDLSGTKRCFELARNMFLVHTVSKAVALPKAGAVSNPNYLARTARSGVEV